MEVACRIGLESLPQLPKESEDALREPIETLCRTTEREVERLSPGYKRKPAHRRKEFAYGQQPPPRRPELFREQNRCGMRLMFQRGMHDVSCRVTTL